MVTEFLQLFYLLSERFYFIEFAFFLKVHEFDPLKQVLHVILALLLRFTFNLKQSCSENVKSNSAILATIEADCNLFRPKASFRVTLVPSFYKTSAFLNDSKASGISTNDYLTQFYLLEHADHLLVCVK